MNNTAQRHPTLDDITAARNTLGDRVRTTPVWDWRGDAIDGALDATTRVALKLELLQVTGTFKPRGALLNALALSSSERARGVTTVSAGNHAIATAYAAKTVGATAKVVMPRTANPARVEKCTRLGAEVVLVAGVHEAFAEVERIRDEEGRTFIHPFESPRTSLGTATCGLEFATQVSDLDAVIIPIGGGGLISGMACAIKQSQPACKVFGVEPQGADTMRRSLEAGEPVSIDKVSTIADSLAAPHSGPYSFRLCQRFVDDVVLVSDDQLRAAMALLFSAMKLAVEPAGAAATAALLGPLRERVAGKRVGVIVCGANIDIDTFYELTKQGAGQFRTAIKL